MERVFFFYFGGREEDLLVGKKKYSNISKIKLSLKGWQGTENKQKSFQQSLHFVPYKLIRLRNKGTSAIVLYASTPFFWFRTQKWKRKGCSFHFQPNNPETTKEINSFFFSFCSLLVLHFLISFPPIQASRVKSNPYEL